MVHRTASKANLQASKYDLSAVRLHEVNFDRVSLNFTIEFRLFKFGSRMFASDTPKKLVNKSERIPCAR